MEKPRWIRVIAVALVLVSALSGRAAVGIHAVLSDDADADAMLLLTYVLGALGLSFLCSVAEAVILSVTPSYIEAQQEKHPRRAAALKRLKQDNLDRSIAAILTLNTIAHTVGAIMAGAEATVVFGHVWVGVFSAAMTLMILFFSEIIPKTIGAMYWSRLAGPTVLFVQILIVTLFPIVWISERLTQCISRGSNVHLFSRDELVAMARVGQRAGQIQDSESRIIRNLFRFGSLKPTDIMTPRTVVSALPEDATVAEAVTHVTRHPFSRLPVYKSSIDEVTGFVLRGDVLLGHSRGQSHQPLKLLRREIIAIPESVSLSALLERFLEDRQHIAIVVDEYGGTKGLVTLEDLVETLIGIEIVDENDTVDDMRALARRQWTKRARALGIDVGN